MMDYRIVVIGGGGHAAVVIDALRAGGADIQGLCDPALKRGAAGPLEVPVLGGDEAIEGMDPARVRLVNGIGSVGSTERRAKVFADFKARGFCFATVLHPSAIVARDVEIGEGGQVMAGSVIQTGARIGDNAIVNSAASIDHDCTIGEDAHIAPGVVLSGNVAVGAGAHLGTGARVIQGVTIGRGAIVGAGVVVLDDVPDGKVLRPADGLVWGGKR